MYCLFFFPFFCAISATIKIIKIIQTEIDQLKRQTRQQNKPLMSNLFSAKTPEEQAFQKLLLHTYHRECLELTNIKRSPMNKNVVTFESEDCKEWAFKNTYKLRKACDKFNNIYLN
jgi:hypothetical protein